MDNWEGWKYLAELSTRGVKSIYGLPRKRDSKIGIGTHILGAKIQNMIRKKTLKSKKKTNKPKNQNKTKTHSFQKRKIIMIKEKKIQ